MRTYIYVYSIYSIEFTISATISIERGFSLRYNYKNFT